MKIQLAFKPTGWAKTGVLVTAALVTGAVTTYSVIHFQSVNSSPPVISQAAVITPNAVAATGYLEPQGEVIKISAPAFMEGAKVQQLLVKQGERVKSGQVLAILDNRDRLQAALKQAQSQVKVAEARLLQVKAGAKKGDINAQDAKFEGTQAELEGQIATQRATIASLEAKLAGERNAQKATIERIKAELENARIDCDRYQSLYQQGAVATQQRDSFCLQQNTTQETLKEAQANLDRIVSTNQEQIAEAQANLNRTIATNRKQIKEAQATLNSVAEVRPVDVQLAKSELEAAQAAVQQAQAELDLAYVRSPRNSRIIKIHTWPGELIGSDGILELGKTDQMYVKAEVYETDITRVRVGQIATIKAQGVIKELKGTVEEIGWKISTKNALGTDPVADADARVVEVKIRLNPESSQQVASLTNLQVNVIINTVDSQTSKSN
ncbi:ABC exporter membrane fusion protein [Nostocaceae cyanobacterium CENA369]|uniref:ABC exporter membrane fusion protein n=1 Tax=Dendronalium phyllosphericum CENA369 TaxID=1725256 RepID=A0A8J7I5G0_9NOST|nr:ABC exporter membrane fusion protein [Dendronalium phyllosphericum]MBH8576285.1 ABC exporter membrane fusion protein [Dendronalium phyllosphericum CENA369]